MVGSYLPIVQAWLESKVGRARGEEGQGALEYGMVVLVIVTAVAVAYTNTGFSGLMQGLFTDIGAQVGLV